MAWTVLKRAALSSDTVDVFEKMYEVNYENAEDEFLENKCIEVICDGYSLEFDDNLKEELGNVMSGRLDILYVDCFKGLSRNFEKVLHVLQIILQSGKAFVTCNYYISNGRIEKRRKNFKSISLSKGHV